MRNKDKYSDIGGDFVASGKKKSIKVLITSGVVGTLILSNIIILLFSNMFTRRYFSMQVKDDVAVITSQVAHIIEKDMISNENTISGLATSFSNFIDVPRAERAAYFENAAKNLGFIEFLYTDVNGNGENLNAEGATFNLSSREYFQRSVKGEVYTSEVLVDLVTGEQIFAISAPYYVDGKIAGIFAGIKDVDYISELCRNFVWKNSGAAAVYDKNSQVVGHTIQAIVDQKINLIEQASKDSSYTKVADFFKQKALLLSNGSGEYYFNGSDKIAGFYNLDSRGLVVLVSIDENEVFEPLNRLLRDLGIITLLIIIISIVFIYFALSNKLAKAFINLKNDIEEIANYNLVAKPSMDYSNRKDEVGDIYRASLSLKNNLIEIVDNIKRSTENLEDSSKILNEQCDVASNVASDIANSVDDIARGATSQAQDTESGVVHIQSMGDLISKNNGNLNNLQDASNDAENLKNQGLDTMGLLLESTKKNKDISGEIKEAMDKTKDSVDEIKLAGEMIKSIAEQTNLLALNAAIEAARAGEAGKGFAVVAEEIRKLAENSSSFTEQINKSVSELLARTNHAVDMINESSDIVNEQSANVSEIEKRFDGIAEAINVLKLSLQEIIDSNEDISKSQNSLFSIMESLSALSEENAASSQQIAASAQTQTSSFEDIASQSNQLLELSSKLKDIIEKFTI